MSMILVYKLLQSMEFFTVDRMFLLLIVYFLKDDMCKIGRLLRFFQTKKPFLNENYEARESNSKLMKDNFILSGQPQ